jgi:hypothetical protein
LLGGDIPAARPMDTRGRTRADRGRMHRPSALKDTEHHWLLKIGLPGVAFASCVVGHRWRQL